MSPRGRPRLATNQKKLKGTDRKDRSFQDEPTPDICIPKKPTFLKGPATKYWNEITVKLAAQKLISTLDVVMLASHCHAYGEAIKIDKEIAKQKKITERLRKKFLEKIKAEDGDEDDVATYSAEYMMIGAKGSAMLSPLVKARERAFKLACDLGREFGLSPVARTRISTGESGGVDEWAEFENKHVG